jgi:uncharacterized protein with HEPN domain
MMENAKIAMRRVVGADWDRFSVDDGLQDMVIRRLAIVGEAARLVSSRHRRATSCPASRGGRSTACGTS